MDGDLQRVLHETLFADVGAERLRPRQGTQLRDRGLDEGQSFRDEVLVRHAGNRR